MLLSILEKIVNTIRLNFTFENFVKSQFLRLLGNVHKAFSRILFLSS